MFDRANKLSESTANSKDAVLTHEIMGPEQWKGAVSSGLPVLCCPSLPFTRRLAGRLFVFSRMDPSLVWVLTCACLGAIVFLHCKGVVWEFASQPHVKSTRTMLDRPKNERDIVKPTVNICAAVIFFVWACPQRVPPFSCLECGARIGCCKRCAIGDYQDERGQGACKSCPPGTTTLGFGPLVYLHIEHKDCTLKVPRKSLQRASHKCVLS